MPTGLKDKMDIKSHLDDAAAELTEAFRDVGNAWMARELRDPNTALRQINKLFNVDGQGTVQLDNDAFNALWDSANQYKGKVAQGSNGLVTKWVTPIEE